MKTTALNPIADPQLFPAYAGEFNTPASRHTIDALVQWTEHEFRDDLARRPSKHVYVRRLPETIVAQIDVLRDSPVIHAAILRQFPPGHVLTPMKHTDELYLSHYNKDFGGDHGLYAKHYDGNLRFISSCAVVRALIYLQSDATYTVVFGDSQLSHPFVTYEFALLDFHRELHWVEGTYDSSSPSRILLKCNYFIAPSKQAWRQKAILATNTSVFYIVKAAMEYAKSPRNPLQFGIGLLCNLFRKLNNAHPYLPLAAAALLIGGAVSTVACLI